MKISNGALALRLWLHASLLFSAAVCFVLVYGESPLHITLSGILDGAVLVFLFSLAFSLPAFITWYLVLRAVNKVSVPTKHKLLSLFAVQLFFLVAYGIPLHLILSSIQIPLSLLASITLSYLFNFNKLQSYDATTNFSTYHHQFQDILTPIKTTMEQHLHTPKDNSPIFMKGMLVAGLILGIFLPTLFIGNMVYERQQRHQEVVKEVNSKWAGAQTFTAPYVSIPYDAITQGKDSKIIRTRKTLLLLADNLSVTANIAPEKRQRSIYKVLLYKSEIHASGNLSIAIPKAIDPSLLHMDEAKICIGLSDFKGIEGPVTIRFADKPYLLSSGLPDNNLADTGLSAPILITAADLNRSIAFDMQLRVKGSERLHFLPVAGNSKFILSSPWPNPSFDGNSLPSTRTITAAGFVSSWEFNKVNLPFGTVLPDAVNNAASLAFGVSMVEPADQYAQTNRAIKYAILIIGLTFCLFFIIEILQKKPVHPVQYTLVGLALLIFYTLLLSISEFMIFGYAYLIAAAATIALITFFVCGHFRKWSTASVFCTVLTGLYGFIYILIQLEDTALLVGSIGLFLILALVMYASRKVNWYGHQPANTTAVQ